MPSSLLRLRVCPCRAGLCLEKGPADGPVGVLSRRSGPSAAAWLTFPVRSDIPLGRTRFHCSHRGSLFCQL